MKRSYSGVKVNVRSRLRSLDASLGYLLALPMILWSAVILVYPVLSTVVMSFHDQRIIGGPAPFVGLALYEKVLLSSEVWAAFGRSLAWTLGNVIVNNTTALVVALLLFQRFRGHSLVESLVLIPWIIPNVIAAIMWRFLLNPSLGVIDYLLVGLGIIDQPLMFLTSAEQAMPTLVGVNVWTWFGFRALIILAALLAVPQELFDAAKVDGANAFQRFRHILLPAILPVLAIVVLLGAFGTFNNVALIWLFTQGGPGEATTTLPVLIYQKSYLTWRVSEAAVLSVLMAVVLAFVAWAYFRLRPPEEVLA